MLEQQYDLAIIGGGLNGVAIARDAAGRGLGVFLCDEGDLGGSNSSATTKLVHGGLERLDWRHLGTMRELVREREILMHAAPHLLRPTRFLIPHHDRMVELPSLRLALMAADRLGRSRMPRSGAVDLATDEGGEPLQSHFATAFAYWDCAADDARLVILNAIDARTRGAQIEPRVRCIIAEREGGRWRLSLESALGGEQSVVHAAILVNAAGAQAAEVHNHVVHSDRPSGVRFSKTTHVVVKPQEPLTAAYALAAGGGRFVNVIPWQHGTVLVGPAERAVEGGATRDVERQDLAALADTVAQYFDAPISADQIVWAYTAVTTMPAEALKRDGHAVLVEAPPRGAPLISVFGGTLAGHRRFAEQVVDMLRRFRPVSSTWTARAALPGGGFPASGGVDLVRALRAAYPFLSEPHALRLVRTYGTRASSILTGARLPSDLGIRFGVDLTEAEVNYLRSEEWALTAEDVLWRRSKLGLAFTNAEAAGLGDWMADRALAGAPA